MSSYLVIDTEVIDEDAFAEFADKIYDAVTAQGGTFLVRGSDLDVIEGDWTPQRLVIMSFDSDDGAAGVCPFGQVHRARGASPASGAIQRRRGGWLRGLTQFADSGRLLRGQVTPCQPT